LDHVLFYNNYNLCYQSFWISNNAIANK